MPDSSELETATEELASVRRKTAGALQQSVAGGWQQRVPAGAGVDTSLRSLESEIPSPLTGVRGEPPLVAGIAA